MHQEIFYFNNIGIDFRYILNIFYPMAKNFKMYHYSQNLTFRVTFRGLIRTKQFQKEVLKFCLCFGDIWFSNFPLGRHVFEQIYPVLTNVERGSRSSFWDHSQLFRTNRVGVIEPNRPTFFVKWCIFRHMYYILGMIFYFCNSSIQ